MHEGLLPEDHVSSHVHCCNFKKGFYKGKLE